MSALHQRRSPYNSAVEVVEKRHIRIPDAAGRPMSALHQGPNCPGALRLRSRHVSARYNTAIEVGEKLGICIPVWQGGQ